MRHKNNSRTTYTIDYAVERKNEIIQLRITGRIEPYVPARLTGASDMWAPAEGGEVEIEDAETEDGIWDGELTDKEEKEICQLLLSEYNNDDSFDEPDDLL